MQLFRRINSFEILSKTASTSSSAPSDAKAGFLTESDFYHVEVVMLNGVSNAVTRPFRSHVRASRMRTAISVVENVAASGSFRLTHEDGACILPHRSPPHVASAEDNHILSRSGARPSPPDRQKSDFPPPPHRVPKHFMKNTGLHRLP